MKSPIFYYFWIYVFLLRLVILLSYFCGGYVYWLTVVSDEQS